MPHDLFHDPAHTRDVITVRQKEYVFIETIRRDLIERTRRIKMENGRKVHFVQEPGSRFTKVYISSEFYPGLCKVKYPIHGKDVL
jgi:ribosomal protein L28